MRDSIRKIKLVILDVDGVLTDGRIIINDSGQQTKAFDAQDGAGMKYLTRAGLSVAIISGRRSKVVDLRCRELGIMDVEQGALNKLEPYERLLKEFRVTDDEVCYVGDDLPDLPVMWRVGYAVAVANARPEVKRAAQYVTRAEGGRGAVREIVEKILKAQGRWAQIMARYTATRRSGKPETIGGRKR